MKSGIEGIEGADSAAEAPKSLCFLQPLYSACGERRKLFSYRTISKGVFPKYGEMTSVRRLEVKSGSERPFRLFRDKL
ncbi:MAG: hypothetical protein LBU32_11755 [Clostridiales bacterium]|nr:hypothetical protein [Clostridiales bacterium]